MSDVLSKEQRSWNMSRVRNKDTKIEILVRKFLFSKGFRFRKNVNSLPGKPDIVLPKYKTVIFVHGCYWHRHSDCVYTTNPKTNIEFWENKFKRNIENDLKHQNELMKMGWRVITIWECELKKENFKNRMDLLIRQITM